MVSKPNVETPHFEDLIFHQHLVIMMFEYYFLSLMQPSKTFQLNLKL
jgi:hypothetical protein